MDGQIGVIVRRRWEHVLVRGSASVRGTSWHRPYRGSRRISETIISRGSLAAQQPTKVTKIRGARILVAEDNPTNQRVTQLILESGGHSATIVENGEAALDALERQ